MPCQKISDHLLTSVSKASVPEKQIKRRQLCDLVEDMILIDINGPAEILVQCRVANKVGV